VPESLPEIEIANLVWRPAGAAAPTLDLRGYSLHVRGGETLLISGASGAGKSTLAAACAGLLGTLVPGELQGTLRVGGVDLVAAAVAREPGPPATLLEQIGVILAGPAPRHALPRLADDVALALESRGVPAALMHAKVRAAITTAGLPERAGEIVGATINGFLLLGARQSKRLGLLGRLLEFLRAGLLRGFKLRESRLQRCELSFERLEIGRQ